MDVWSDKKSPAYESDDEGRVIWLFDPESTAPDAGLACTPVELFMMLDGAADRIGLADVAVTGSVCGLQRRGRYCTFELAEQLPGSDTPEAIIRVVVFAAVLREVDAMLARTVATS